ncbi:helix-turn-helix domain-containing protein [Marinobacter sp. ATCH36]|uniref:GlxA family transcriptional regulator n=1 Tax=Marinobacter sp. ATCH36 TaxID=2945106 RepID=UPI00202133E2|nr:helix-turn-helix domain-containing protein [Marinobacter sp. ATCH36]MCL7945421.1 helix-turn-helix domain-containing protein [Marinobacter sp. ATCH36]
MDVTVVLVEGGAPSTAVAPVEIFRSAGVLWSNLLHDPPHPCFQVRTASLDGKPVNTLFGLALTPDCSVLDITATDLVVIAAIGVDFEAACLAHKDLYPWLREQYRQGSVIAASCAGVVLVAEAGLLDGKSATTHWGLVDVCRQRYPLVNWQPERILTDSENIVCGGGVYSAVDLSLYLVEKLRGHRLAMETARALVLKTPRVWQIGYSTDPPNIDHDDERIARVQEWLLQNFDEPVSADKLAAKANMSQSTFSRRFKKVTGETPTNYLHGLRVNVARHLLENDQRSVQEISYAVGYSDVRHFRTLFIRYTGLSPREYRKQFAANPAY